MKGEGDLHNSETEESGVESDGKSDRSSSFTLDPSHLYIDDPKKNTTKYEVNVALPMPKCPAAERMKETTGFMASTRMMYTFSDSTDMKLMSVGVFCALLQAGLPPFVWLMMGNFVTLSITREEVRMMNVSSLNDSSLLDSVDNDFASSATPSFIAMLSLSIAMFFSAFIQRLAWEVSAIRQVFRMKKDYIRKVLHMDVAWLESRQSGQVAAMMHEHADNIYNGLADHLPMVLFITVYLLVNIAVCLWVQWDVMLLMLIAIPVLIGTRIIFSKWFAKTMDEETKLQTKLTNLVSETFNCIRTVISFGAQKQTINKFEKISGDHKKLTDERLRSSTVYDSLTQVLLTELIFTAALCYGIWRVADKSPGALCALAINMLYMCVTSISIGFHMHGIATAKKNVAEMSTILKESPLIEIDRCQLARQFPEVISKVIACTKMNKDTKMKGKGVIRIKDVHFSYPTRPDIEVIKGLTLTIEAGERVAIVGRSGSGKSTITALLLRFYLPTKGVITLDDNCIVQHLTPDIIRSQCSLVSQEPVLFDGTISDNIRYGRLDATQQEINEAARKVGAWQFISSLPEGMQTRVGDRGMQLSGGQKQRIAIARAVIRKPLVMIFDEATSALDTKHEEEVQTAIDLASEGLTTITIAHRLSTVRNADRIIVLEEGRIVEEGKPADLLAKEGGRYQRMYNDQKIDQLVENQPVSRPSLMHAFSYGPVDAGAFLDPEVQRRAWARNSLGAHKKLGKSYSVINSDKEKLALPVMSKKKRLDYKNSYVTKVGDTGSFEEEDNDELPGKVSSFDAVWCLIRGFKHGYQLLALAVPTTIIRSFFYLLICFEVASVLELSIVPEEARNQEIFMVAAIYTALIIIKTIFEALGRLSIALYGHGFCSYMRSEMFRQVMRHGTAYFDQEKNSPGRLVHKIITDSSTLNKIMEEKLDILIPALICSVFSIIVALFINWKMALLCSFQFPAYFIIRIVQIREGSKRQRQMMEEEKKAAGLAAVVLSNMTTIKAYNLQEHFYSVFCDAIKPLTSAMKRQSVISAFVFACQYSFTYILIALTLYFGTVMMLSNEISVFNYMRVVLLTQFGANFFSQLVASVTDLTKAKISAENIVKVIKEPAFDMDNLTEAGCRPKIEGSLTLQNVSFRYPSRPLVPILKNLSLRVEAGKSIALVGPSGSGKSTIAGLFQRMYTPNEGNVLVDQYNVKNINPSYLRRVIVSVGQEPTLFSFTIRENIAYGMIESEATTERIIEAAKIANIHDFIISLPQGYDTEVGEFGAQLSGGQKQRIAIARAIVRKPVVLLLDEATAALDSWSEKAVKQAFYDAGKHCTILHIAHRLSSIRHVDNIYVLVDGKVVEEGNHDELLSQKGIYYEMIQSS